MKKINNYILEKFKISKDIISDEQAENNRAFIDAITNYVKYEYNIILGKYPNTISVSGKNKDYILLTLEKQYRIKYRHIMEFIDKHWPIRKDCTTNNQSIYIYPKYE